MPGRPKFGAAFLWSVVMSMGENSLQTLVTLALAVYLGPSAFGLLAIAWAYLAFMELLLDQGLTAALVQRPDLEDTHLDSAFWMVLAGSVVLALVSVALSGWWAQLYQMAELESVVIALSAIIPLQGLTIVQRAVLQRTLNIRVLAVRSNVAVLVGGAVAIVLAARGAGYWALVAQHLTQATVGLILLWSLSSWRPHLRFSARSARELFGVSSGALIGAIGVFVNNRADALLMGFFFASGSAAVSVGLYRLADRIVNVLVNIAGRSVQLVALPEFSRHQFDPPKLVRSLLTCLRLSATMAVPPLAIVAVASADITKVLGTKWLPAADALGVLCAVGIARGLMVLTGPLMRGLGRSRAHGALVWAHAVPSALSIAVAAHWYQEAAISQQASGIAWVRAVLFACVFLPVNWAILSFLGRVSVWRLVAAITPACAAGLIGAACFASAAPLLQSLGVPSNAGTIAGLAIASTAALIALSVGDPELRLRLSGLWLRFRGERARLPSEG